jgi:acetyltransferase-like isoleucine patch superfamily enzyme
MNDHASQTAPSVIDRSLIAAAEHRRLGRQDAAAILYREVLSVAPTNVDALYGLAIVLRDSGDRGEAERVLRDASSHTPHDERLAEVLAEILATPAAMPGQRRGFARRAARRVVRPTLEAAAQKPRILKYRALSTCRQVTGSPRRLQPVLLVGPGAIAFGEDVQLGWYRSPLFYAGYCHFEVSSVAARIEIGDHTEFNNNAFVKSEGAGIRIGARGLFGANIEIFDSNFHDLDPARRHGGNPRMAPVEIEENVFMGMSVKVLKGVTIGRDSVIGAGAVVSASIPAGVIAAGNPARVVREL